MLSAPFPYFGNQISPCPCHMERLGNPVACTLSRSPVRWRVCWRGRTVRGSGKSCATWTGG